MAPVPAAPLAVSRYLHRRGQAHWGVLLYRIGLLLVACGGIILLFGFHEPPLPRAWAAHISWNRFTIAVHVVQGLLMSAYFADVFRRASRDDEPEAHESIDWVDWLTLLLVVGGAVVGALWRPGWAAFHAGLLLALVVEFWRLFVTMIRYGRPGLVLPVSFGTMILLGAPLLKLPVALEPGRTLSWFDALFTATSAVCVTGLVLHPTAEHFTPVGHAILGVLIQLGGLGIVIFGSMIAVLLGRNISLREHLSLSQMLDDLPLHRIRAMVRFILLATLTLELLGAAALYLLWDESITGARRLGWSAFHAVSAYCNAGVDLTGQSLTPYRFAMVTHAVIAPLALLGSLGFPVMVNLCDVARHRLARWWRPRRPGVTPLADPARWRLSLHSRIVLTTTAGLFVAGFLIIAVGQLVPHFHAALGQGVSAHADRPAALGAAGLLGVAADASFLSLAGRTAGFNSMPVDELAPAGRITLMALMLVGGSPGSAAGGVKTTVVAILVLSVVATIRQRRETEAFGRAISDSLVRKAGTVFMGYVGLVVVGTLLLALSEPFPFEKILFEVVSAVATAGLSLGITPELSTFGKGVILGLMFLGRVGPLALLGAVLVRRPGMTRPYEYPHENVAIG